MTEFLIIFVQDDIKDIYQTESEVIANQALQKNEDAKSDEDEKDVALDVRVRLVQAQNQMVCKLLACFLFLFI